MWGIPAWLLGESGHEGPLGPPRWHHGKEPACQGWGRKSQSLGRDDPLEEEIETHFSILAWKVSWTEEPGGLQSRGSQRVGRD